MARTPESGVNSLEVGPKRKYALVGLWILFPVVTPVIQGFSHLRPRQPKLGETVHACERSRRLGSRLCLNLVSSPGSSSLFLSFPTPSRSLSLIRVLTIVFRFFSPSASHEVASLLISLSPVDSLPPRGARAFPSFPPIANTAGSIRFKMRFIYASALLCAVAAEASQHTHGRLHHRHHDKKDVHEKRGGKCQFPSDAGLVSITPGSMNRGWAMSPDQPCEPGSYCPYACPPGQVSMQWDPKATSYPSPLSMVGCLISTSGLAHMLIVYRTVVSTAMRTAKSRSLSPTSPTARMVLGL